MKVLVTGGAGYIGSVLSRQLLAAGHEVRAFDSLLHGGHALLGLVHEPGFEFRRGDVRVEADVGSALEGIDALVHLAAIVGDPACARQPDLAKAVNLEASVRLIERAQRAGVRRLVFASTCSNYGRMASHDVLLTEESALRPVSLYAETKVAVERAMLGLPASATLIPTVLRFATIFGLSPRMRFDLTVNEFTLELMTKGRVTVFGEQFWRPYVHVQDAARAIGLVLDAPIEHVARQAFNVGDTSQNFQKGRLVELIRAQISNDVEVERVQKVEDPRDYRVSFEKIQRVLDFRIAHTVETGIRELVRAIDQGLITDFENPRYRN